MAKPLPFLMPLCAFFLLALPPLLPAAVDPNTFRFSNCSNSTPSFPSHGVAQLLTSFVSHSNSYRFFNSNFSDQIYGFYQCRGDLSLPQCASCVSLAANSSTYAASCPNGAAAAVVFLDGCTLIFKNYSFYADDLAVEDPLFWEWNASNDTNATWRTNRDRALISVANNAPTNGGYNVTEVGPASDPVYALAQCQGYLSQQDCGGCLGRIVSHDIQSLIGNQRGGKVFYWSCSYRFEAYLFYEVNANNPPPASPPGPGTSRNKTLGRLIGTAVGTSAIILILCTVTALYAAKRKRGRNKPLGLEETEMTPNFHSQTRLFSLDELQRATQNFHSSNMLGEGGFGSVYKGTLDDGQQVAIKKLSSLSPHGRRQFVNEVNLITTVQHRNLIKLIGCCAEGPERLLIYEYLLNISLDKHLFEGRPSLSWNTRVQIILGTARGLAYLHEESQVRIVHRDIKAANVLLDEYMNPKIADFGLARLFADDESHVSTVIAGTFGYLAPEYALHGQLTEKADIFSFGVVALETISGRKNRDSSLPPEQHYLIQWAWRMFQEHCQLALVDPRLGNSFVAEEVILLVHVALLCTQAAAELRPAMSKVVLMLAGRAKILDVPMQPAFVEQQMIMKRITSSEDGSRTPLYIPPPSTSGTLSSTITDTNSSMSIYTPLVHAPGPTGVYHEDDVVMSSISVIEPR